MLLDSDIEYIPFFRISVMRPFKHRRKNINFMRDYVRLPCAAITGYLAVQRLDTIFTDFPRFSCKEYILFSWRIVPKVQTDFIKLRQR